MSKNKKIMIICVVYFALALIPYISYRIFTYIYYMDNTYLEASEKIIKNLNNEEFVTINKKDYQGDYLEYKNVKIANEFDEFLLSSKMKFNNGYIFKDKATFVIGTTESELNRLKEVQNYCIDCKETINQIITENNLENDTDLFNYLKSYDFSKNTFLTNPKIMRTNYIINNYIIMFIPQFSKITYIKGDYNGYIYESEDRYEVVLEHKNKHYLFIFSNLSKNEFYTKEKVYNLISTVVFK